ncbi:16773_t:CDS:2, partial [Gigaspora margarita]
YVESKSDISDDVFETLKEEIRSILLSYKSSCNTNENSKNKAGKILSSFDKSFPQLTIEKTSESTNARKRRKIHPEYTKLGNNSTQLDMIVEL